MQISVLCRFGYVGYVVEDGFLCSVVRENCEGY